MIRGAVHAELLAHPKVTKAIVDGFLTATGVIVDFKIDDDLWLEAAWGYVDHVKRRQVPASPQAKRLLVDFVIGAHASLYADR